MRLRAWYAVVPAFVALAVVADRPAGCESSDASGLRLVACAQIVEYRDVQYEVYPIDKPVARRDLREPRVAVEPGCSDVGMVTDCGVVANQEPDTPTEVRPIRGLAPADLLAGGGDKIEPNVVLVPFDGDTGWMLTKQARRFINRHSDQRLPANYGVVANS